jgi:Rieske Fe-S protein
MDASRREFVRRVLSASILLVVGGVAVWDLLDGAPPGGAQQTVQLLQASTTQQSTAPSGSSQSSQTVTQSVPAGYVLVTGIAALSGRTSAYFNHPTGGLSMLLSLNGQWKAFSATCTHAPCTVGYSGSQIQCPCHGGIFDPSNGSVISGPPPTRLPEYGVVVQNNNLFVSNAPVN